MGLSKPGRQEKVADAPRQSYYLHPDPEGPIGVPLRNHRPNSIVALQLDPLDNCMQNHGRLGYFLDPPHVPLLRALWSRLNGIWGVLTGSWGCWLYLGFEQVFCGPLGSRYLQGISEEPILNQLQYHCYCDPLRPIMKNISLNFLWLLYDNAKEKVFLRKFQMRYG